MPPTFLRLRLIGQLSLGSKLSGIDSGEERDGLFHRLFEARAELMTAGPLKMGPQPPPIALEYV